MTKGIEKSIQETSGAGSKIPNSLRSKERAITKMMMIIFLFRANVGTDYTTAGDACQGIS